MNLRSAVAADIPALASLTEAAYRASFAGILEPAALATRDAAWFSRHFAEALPRLTLAIEGEEILGFSQVTDGHLDMLFVAPAQQGGGIGTALLAASDARSLDCFRDNAAARHFYERHGWRLTRAYARPFLGATRDFVFYERP